MVGAKRFMIMYPLLWRVSNLVDIALLSFAGWMLGTFLIQYCVLTLFGSFLIYRDVEDTGCDTSENVVGNVFVQYIGNTSI
jgi:hypothetical protein